MKHITLIEVMIVVAIVAILAAIAIPNINSIVNNRPSKREEFLTACAAEGTGPVTCQALWDARRHRY